VGAGGAEAAGLDPDSRSAALAALAGAEFQVLVVGGGVVGAGVALDAATRGLSVGLVEARDFGAGTSSRSSKLIHGGLRYLEQLNLGLVREALAERSLLLGVIAPHLVRPVPFLFPLTHHLWERAYVGTGVSVYDALSLSFGHTRGLPGHHQLSRRAALRVAPALKRSAITGAIAYWDAQVDDARYVLTLIRTAAGYGAQVASRVQVRGLLREGERVTGVRAVDLETGAEIGIRAQQVVNATGVWTDEIQAMVGGRGMINLRVAKGVHLVVPKDRVHSSTGIIARQRGYEQFGLDVGAATAELVFEVPGLDNLDRMIRTGQPVIISDTALDPKWVRLAAHEGLAFLVCRATRYISGHRDFCCDVLYLRVKSPRWLYRRRCADRLKQRRIVGFCRNVPGARRDYRRHSAQARHEPR
jgi:glycine/D-amino acid oxidase-like deaminating enzyme